MNKTDKPGAKPAPKPEAETEHAPAPTIEDEAANLSTYHRAQALKASMDADGFERMGRLGASNTLREQASISKHTADLLDLIAKGGTAGA